MALIVLPASGPEVERILDDTFPLWRDGLTRAAYGRFWTAQIRTPWGSGHLGRVALQDGRHLVSSAKRYDLAYRIDGRIRRVLGIGAVFTPPAYRGRGAARQMLTQLLETAEAEGYEYAALFSEIAPAFYEQLDFVPVPTVDWRLDVDRKDGGPPAMLVRSGEDRDLPGIADIQAARGTAARLSVERSEDYIRYGLAKKRMLAGLGAPGARFVEFLVSEEGHQPVAYLVCVVQGQVWTIEEAGDRDPSGARLGGMLQVMLSRHPGEAPPVIRGWWPASLRPPQVHLSDPQQPGEILMLRPLKDRSLPLPPLSADDIAYWHGDVF